MGVKRYAGQQILVSYDTEPCLHAAESVRGLPAVFDTEKRPWIVRTRAVPRLWPR